MPSPKPHLVTLCILLSFPLVGAMIFSLALAAVLKHYAISTSASQMTVVCYLAGYAFGQLPYGWLASRLGNKRTITIGLSIFTIGALIDETRISFL